MEFTLSNFLVHRVGNQVNVESMSRNLQSDLFGLVDNICYKLKWTKSYDAEVAVDQDPSKKLKFLRYNLCTGATSRLRHFLLSIKQYGWLVSALVITYLLNS